MSDSSPMQALLAFWRGHAPQNPVLVDLDAGPALDAGTISPLSLRTPDAPLDPGLSGLRRADLLRVRTIDQLRPAEDLFFRNRIDAVLFPADPDIAALLSYHRFGFFALVEGKVQPVTTVPGQGPVLALHHRFVLAAASPDARLDIASLLRAYSLEARGMICATGRDGEEFELYRRAGFKRMLFISPDAAAHARTLQRLKNQPGVNCLLCALSDTNGLQSPAPGQPGGAPLVPMRRLDFLLRETGHDPNQYNFLHLALAERQSAALRGATDCATRCDGILCDALYQPRADTTAPIDDVDDLLEPIGYQRLVTLTPRPAAGEAFLLRAPTVTMRKLGQWGRFGNQVFEYAFTKLFGRRHRLRVRTSPWIGNQLFGADDPLVDPTREFSQHLETTYALRDSKVAAIATRPVNFDLCGVFQYHTAYYRPHKEFLTSLFRPVPALRDTLDGALRAVMQARGARTLIALHLRRGDYGFGLFFIPPNAWYLDWLAPLWPTLDAPMLYIAADEPDKVLPDFAAYRPITVADLKLPAFGADYYPDYYFISQAKHAAISNSSYSFSACMWNQQGGTFFRPDLFAGRLLPFDPWDSEPLLHRELGILDHRQVQQVVPHFLQRPGDAQLANAVRSWRVQLAESFTQIRGDQIQLVLSMDLWTCYRELRRCNLRPAPLVEVERRTLDAALARLNSTQGLDRVGPYVAATMFLEPQKLPSVDLSSFSADVQGMLRT